MMSSNHYNYYRLAMKYRDLFVSVNDEIVNFLHHALKTDISVFEASRQVKNILEAKRQELKKIDFSTT